MTSANEFLMGRGGMSAKWPYVGYTVTGVVMREPKVEQQTEFKKGGGVGKPLTFDNGEPRLQLVVQLQTSERDPANAQDVGVRNAYIKGKNMTTAVREAILAAFADVPPGAVQPGIEVGGTLSLTWTGGGPRWENDNDGPPREWAAQYWRPAATNPAANQFIANGGQPAAAPAGPAQYPPQQQYPGGYPGQQPGYPAAQPAYQPGPPAQQYATAPAQAPTQPPYQAPPPPVTGPVRPPQVDEAKWAAMNPQQQAAVAAAVAQQPAPNPGFGETPPF